MADMLPKLFFVHFQETSFAAEQNGVLAGFLVGFFSQTYPDQSYIHFVGVNPAFREQGVGRRLYEHFFASSLKGGRKVVRCVTSPVNRTSLAFHMQMGFVMEPSDTLVDGIPVHPDYDGSGGDRILLVKHLGD